MCEQRGAYICVNRSGRRRSCSWLVHGLIATCTASRSSHNVSQLIQVSRTKSPRIVLQSVWRKSSPHLDSRHSLAPDLMPVLVRPVNLTPPVLQEEIHVPCARSARFREQLSASSLLPEGHDADDVVEGGLVPGILGLPPANALDEHGLGEGGVEGWALG